MTIILLNVWNNQLLDHQSLHGKGSLKSSVISAMSYKTWRLQTC